jgi:ABC-type Fe3+ transport system substrate-binding protein
MSRPAFIVVGEKATVNRRKVLEFMLGEKGQALVANGDFLPVITLPQTP